MEIAKNKQWCSLPVELAHLIAEMTGRFKLRNGVLMQQISKDDPRRQVLENIPKIVLSSYDNGENEVLVSKVESKIQINKNIIKFNINLIVFQNPIHRVYMSTDNYYININNVYKYNIYTFGIKNINISRLFEELNETMVIVKLDGTVIHVFDEY